MGRDYDPAVPDMLADRLQADLTAAMKARDELRMTTLRSAISAIREARVSGATARELSDEDVEAVLRTQVKRRDEAAEAFRSGNRGEQADRELAEKAILEDYLPTGLDEAEVAAIVDTVLAEGEFTEASQMGQAMKAVMAAVAGRADGKVVSSLVKERLSS